MPELFATAPPTGLLSAAAGNNRTPALGTATPLLTTVPVNFCAKGKFVTAKEFVMGVKWLVGLVSLSRYFPTRVCTKSA